MFDDHMPSFPHATLDGDCGCACALLNASLLRFPIFGGATMIESIRVPPSLTPRFWYAALIDCGASMTVAYTLTWKQASGSQLGYDEVGVDAMYIAAVVLWGGAIALHAWMRRREGLRAVLCPGGDPLGRGMSAAVVLWFLMGFCGMVHWSAYAGDGVGAPGIAIAGDVFGVRACTTPPFACTPRV